MTVAFWVRDSYVGSLVAPEFADTVFHHTDGVCFQEPAPVNVVFMFPLIHISGFFVLCITSTHEMNVPFIAAPKEASFKC